VHAIACLLQMNIGTLLFHFLVSLKLQFFTIVSLYCTVTFTFLVCGMYCFVAMQWQWRMMTMGWAAQWRIEPKLLCWESIAWITETRLLIVNASLPHRTSSQWSFQSRQYQHVFALCRPPHHGYVPKGTPQILAKFWHQIFNILLCGIKIIEFLPHYATQSAVLPRQVVRLSFCL